MSANDGGDPVRLSREPVAVFSLAEILGDEMLARGWTIEDAAARMRIDGPARDALYLAIWMAVHSEKLRLTDSFVEGLSRAFNVSPDFFRNVHQRWLDNPSARQPYSVPDSLFGPWLRASLC